MDWFLPNGFCHLQNQTAGSSSTHSQIFMCAFSGSGSSEIKAGWCCLCNAVHPLLSAWHKVLSFKVFSTWEVDEEVTGKCWKKFLFSLFSLVPSELHWTAQRDLPLASDTHAEFPTWLYLGSSSAALWAHCLTQNEWHLVVVWGLLCLP